MQTYFNTIGTSFKTTGTRFETMGTSFETTRTRFETMGTSFETTVIRNNRISILETVLKTWESEPQELFRIH